MIKLIDILKEMHIDASGRLQQDPEDDANKLQSLGFNVGKLDPNENFYYLRLPDGTVSIASKNKDTVLRLKKTYPEKWKNAVLYYDNRWQSGDNDEDEEKFSLNENKKLNTTGAEMDYDILPQFTENGKYSTNSNQRILIIKNPLDEPKIVAQDALNKWKEINTYLKQFDDGNKWLLRGISMGYKEPEAEDIAKELLKLYPSGEIKRWNADNIYFIFPLLDISRAQQNE